MAAAVEERDVARLFITVSMGTVRAVMDLAIARFTVVAVDDCAAMMCAIARRMLVMLLASAVRERVRNLTNENDPSPLAIA
jgi:hypothetical protein